MIVETCRVFSSIQTNTQKRILLVQPSFADHNYEIFDIFDKEVKLLKSKLTKEFVSAIKVNININIDKFTFDLGIIFNYFNFNLLLLTSY
jgi:hypothetical protein